MIDPMGLAGMLFVLIMMAMIGGFVLLLPITRRLGAYLEQRMESGKPAESGYAELLALQQQLAQLQSQLDMIAERQEFTEQLLGPGAEIGSDRVM